MDTPRERREGSSFFWCFQASKEGRENKINAGESRTSRIRELSNLVAPSSAARTTDTGIEKAVTDHKFPSREMMDEDGIKVPPKLGLRLFFLGVCNYPVFPAILTSEKKPSTPFPFGCSRILNHFFARGLILLLKGINLPFSPMKDPSVRRFPSFLLRPLPVFHFRFFFLFPPCTPYTR